MLSEKDVEDLAQLARIELKSSEKKSLLPTLESILSYVGEISEVVTEDRPIAEGIVKNVLRTDSNDNIPGSYSEAILKNAPSTEDDYLKVKQII
jgi:aspartyl-tRNA(Asn)/glutamyl-tRNA(Gln) amidotransferase subunit C